MLQGLYPIMNKPHIVPLFVCIAALSTGLSAQGTLVEKPDPVSTLLPNLSRELVEAQGEVLLEVTINAYGYVTQAYVKSTTNPELNDPCVAAVSRWKYSPAKKDGKPIPLTFLQPLRFGEFTISAESHPATKPRVLHQEAPERPENLKQITGEVVLLIKLGTEGQILSTAVQKSTHEELNDFALQAVRKWRFAPAIKEDKPVESSVYVPFHFYGEAPAAGLLDSLSLVDNAELIPIRQAAPDLPPSIRKPDGEVEIQFVVDKGGFVTNAEVKKASNKELGEIARAAVLEWKFQPVIKNGVPASVRVLQPFIFGKGVIAVESLDKLPRVTRSEDPILSEGLKEAKGYVIALFELDQEGKVIKVQAKESSLPELEAPVLAAARNWKFTPAVKKGTPIKSKVIVPIHVNL